MQIQGDIRSTIASIIIEALRNPRSKRHERCEIADGVIDAGLGRHSLKRKQPLAKGTLSPGGFYSPSVFAT